MCSGYGMIYHSAPISPESAYNPADHPACDKPAALCNARIR